MRSDDVRQRLKSRSKTSHYKKNQKENKKDLQSERT
jgi:hypothetical protein